MLLKWESDTSPRGGLHGYLDCHRGGREVHPAQALQGGFTIEITIGGV